MDSTARPKAGLGLLGAGAAACAACCAGPVLGFLAATGLASAAAAVALGLVGWLAVLIAAAVLGRYRRRRARSCAPPVGQVGVDPPTRRATSG